MNRRLYVGALALTAMAMSIALGDDALKSGPQPGKNIPGPFHPTNITGAQAGKKHCLV
jgi:hypothetical protein